MTRTREVLFVVLALSAATVTVVACGSSDSRYTEDVDSGDERKPDASSSADAGLYDADAAVDAKPDADFDASNEPVTCASTPCVTQLTAGDNHFCALISDGTVRCWGDDTKGELGAGDPDGGITGFGPVNVTAIPNVTQVSAAGTATCALGGDGHVYCWGGNSFAQLGLQASPGETDDDPHPTPADVGLPGKITRVDVGAENAYAIADDGGVYGWGGNDYMQLTIEDYGYFPPALLGVQSYALTRTGASFGSALGLTTDGQLVGWGKVTGRSSTLDSAKAPAPLVTLSGVTSFAIDATQDEHACAVSHGALYCWGYNTKGVLGIGVPDSELLPTLAPTPSSDTVFPQQVAAAANSTCVRMTDGSIQCCGDNTLGQLGQGTVGPLAQSFAAATAFKDHAVQVVVSLNTTCALLQNGDVMCWGGNSMGELGQGNNDLVAHPTPTKVVIPSSPAPK